MKAMLYADWEELRLVETAIPVPGPDEVRIRVQAAGICGSELEAIRKHSPRRPPPLILGHEFTGVIDLLGSDVIDWTVGDHVVANAVIADGACAPCQRGQTHLCLNRQLFGMHRPGAFAEFVCAPARVLIRRPERVGPRSAALTEPLANGVHIANLLVEIRPEKVLVIGAGPIGLLAMQALKIKFDAEVAVMDRSESRLQLALKLGAAAVFLPEDDSGIRGWSDQDGLPATVDAVGAATTKEVSITRLRPGGTAVWIGLHENTSPFNAYDLILAEKRVQGSYACTQEELTTALEWIAEDVVDVSSWTSIFDLSESDKAVQTMLNPGPQDVKGVILMRT